MQNLNIDSERLRDKISLVYKVNYISSILCLVLFFICLLFLKIETVIPYVFLTFGVLNLLNTVFFDSHKKLTNTYTVTTVLALVATFIITIYSGGILSPFIYVFGLIVFAGYAATRVYGNIHLYLTLLLVAGIYVMGLPSVQMVQNVVPEDSKSMFGLLCALFTTYMMGGVFGKFLLKGHHRLYKSKVAIETKINEKETLLKEIHHRVKNNLQTVSSLLNLQSKNISDKEVKSLFKSNQNRVIAMAMVHEMLYERDDLSKIDYKPYVQELSEYLVRSAKGVENKVRLRIDIPDIQLGIDTAIPLGLLINEAVTNSLKYGIKGDDEGEIHIALRKEEQEQDFVLNIGDDGAGFPNDVNFQTTKTLGLKLIHNLARQLRGSVTKDASKKGTNYIITFKEVEPNTYAFS